MAKELDPDNPQKEYTGVWIPKEVMECRELSAIDKLVYGEVACFDECYASNEWLAKRIGRSVTTASKCISKLIDLGFVEPCGFNGRFRLIRVVKKRKPCRKLKGSLAENDKAAFKKTANIDKSKDKSKDNIDTKVSIEQSSENLPTNEVVRTQRSLDIDEAFNIWNDEMGYPLAANKTDRRYINILLNKKEMDLSKLRMMVRLVAASQSDKYKRFSITNYTDLYYKTNDLMAWAREKQAQQQTNPTAMEI
jgi:hypothetical protein